MGESVSTLSYEFLEKQLFIIHIYHFSSQYGIWNILNLQMMFAEWCLIYAGISQTMWLFQFNSLYH